MNQYTFADLFAPMSTEQFLADYWEKETVHVVRKQPDFFSQLYSRSEIERSVFGGHFTPGKGVRVIKGKDRINLSADFDARELSEYYGQGYTINLLYLDKQHVQLGRLANAIENTLGLDVLSNLYLTPANSQAFNVHIDTHDVLILQLDGAKEWVVFDPPNELEMDNVPMSLSTLPAEPKLKIRLEAGDVLYVPRGFPHYAYTAEDTSSLHITLGLHGVTYADLLQTIIDKMARQDVRLRRYLPAGILTQTPQIEQLGATLAELVQQEIPDDIVTAALRHQRKTAIQKRSVPNDSAHLFSDEQIEVGLDTSLHKYDADYKVVQEDNTVFLICMERDLNLAMPAGVAPAARFILSTANTFKVRDLPFRTDKSKLILANRLLDTRLVSLAPAG